MNFDSENIYKSKCLICNKIYASASSLCNHNKKFHKIKSVSTNQSNQHNDQSNNDKSNNNQSNNKSENQSINATTIQLNSISNQINNDKNYKCNYCNNIYKHAQSKHKHQKICKKKNTNSINNLDLLELKKKNIELEKKNEEIEKKNEEIKNSLDEIKELLLINNKIHPKTLQKINKNLINNNNNTTNNTNNINTTNNTINNNNNNTIINKTYVNFYDPIDYKILNEKEKLNILSLPWKSLEESIKTIHFNNKFPEYKNIFITNRKDDNAYIFDGNKFSSVSKNEALNDLINSHMDEIESSTTDYEDKLSETKLKHLNKFIETINDNDKKFIHENLKKTFPNYRIYKCDLIKHLIFNNSDPKLLEKLKSMDLKNKITEKEINISEPCTDNDISES